MFTAALCSSAECPQTALQSNTLSSIYELECQFRYISAMGSFRNSVIKERSVIAMSRLSSRPTLETENSDVVVYISHIMASSPEC